MSEASTDSVGHIVKKMSPMEWIVLGSAGLGLIVFLRYRKAQQAAASSSDQTAALNALSGTGGLAGLLANQNPTSAGASPITTSTAPLDNESWAQQAQAALVSHGGFAPLDINQAFGNFLSGQPLTTVQQGIINAAENMFGPPPLSVPNIQVAPSAPTPAPAPAPAPTIDLTPIEDLLRQIPVAAPAPPPPAQAPAHTAPTVPQIMSQQDYLNSRDLNWAAFSAPGGWLDQFFANPNQVQIIGGNGAPATTTEVLADLQAHGKPVNPNWKAIN